MKKLKYIIFIIIYFLLYPLAKVLFGRKRNWLICERGFDAQDNGFIFFKYVCKNHNGIKATYIAKKGTDEYRLASSFGNVVNFCSFKHFLMAIGCRVKISSHLFGYSPWVQMTTYLKKHKNRDIHVFLQHGIIKNFHKSFLQENCKSLKIFICGALPEYDYISSRFHYKNDEVKYTGLARYDTLCDISNQHTILIMPTWRANMVNYNDADFLKSDFYKCWCDLLSNKKFLEICKKNDIKIRFYLHISFQKFTHLFKHFEFIDVVSYGEENVQNLLKSSSLLVTDFSSVFFDFAYMKKPIIYYQFDEDSFYTFHYEKGYFDYRRDGFGPVLLKPDDVVQEIEKLIINGFNNDSSYIYRQERFFKYRDTHNCERIYNAIISEFNRF